jgi:four helix bundle protein
MSYRNLEIWCIAQQLTTEIHTMTLTMLPRHELYEQGSQIRRSIKSVRSNIVEGYGRRRYKQDLIRFLTYAQASCDETMDHLHILKETGSLTGIEVFESIREGLDHLGRKLNKFIRAVESGHTSAREPESWYSDQEEDREPSNEYRVSSIEDRES